MIKVYTAAELTEGLEQEWLQHLRDFDVAHPGCHFEVMIDASDMPLVEMIKRLKVNPGLTFQQIIERKK